MNDEGTTRIFHPFEAGFLDFPRTDARFLVIGAGPDFRPPENFAPQLSFSQGFRPYFLSLQKSGYAVSPVADGDGYDGALVFAGRNRRENETWLAQAVQRVRPGGTIAVAGGKKEGGASLAKRTAAVLPLDGSMPKAHGVVFWLTKPENVDPETLATLDARPAVFDGFVAAVGGFSSDGIDDGSRLLAENLPPDLCGRMADFGAGWGYLSVALARAAGGIEQIDLYEAHHTSLEAARRNLEALAPGTDCRFHWQDLIGEPVEETYDAIVMNPPFHQGRKAEPDIGKAMIERAASSLRKGGRLFMVANRPLPYEPVLAVSFKRYAEICRDGAFKVLVAVK